MRGGGRSKGGGRWLTPSGRHAGSEAAQARSTRPTISGKGSRRTEVARGGQARATRCGNSADDRLEARLPSHVHQGSQTLGALGCPFYLVMEVKPLVLC